MRELKAADKVTQKMTRDGAVKENLSTGEVERISDRDPVIVFSTPREPAVKAKEVVKQTTRTHQRRAARKRRTEKFRHRPMAGAANQIRFAAHDEVDRAEQENVGVEAGHVAEEFAEHGVGYAGERVWANAEYLYQKAIHDDPTIAASNPVSRYLQKKRLQRDYTRRIRRAQKASKRTATDAKRGTKGAKDGMSKALSLVRENGKMILIAAGVLASVALLFGGISACSMLGGSGMGSIFSSSYLSEDTDMLAAEAAYCEMEEKLRNELDNYETLHPGCDEYRFDLDEIEHDPYVLISILSAFHGGMFTADEVQEELKELFQKQYILTETVETETRYRTETRTESRTVTDPDTGETVTEEYEREVEVPYAYSVCSVKLENFDLSHLPVYIMDEKTLSLYATYMGSLGNREDMFPESPYVAKYTNPPATYEIPASALEDKTFAKLITEAEKYIGYPYVWGGSSPATSFDCSGFVSWVLTNSGVCKTGRLGAQSLFEISTPVSAANARPGDLIFFAGTYDTDGVSHVGIYVGGGKMLHCGDPIQYADINSTYWRNHFYAFARPPYN